MKKSLFTAMFLILLIFAISSCQDDADESAAPSPTDMVDSNITVVDINRPPTVGSVMLDNYTSWQQAVEDAYGIRVNVKNIPIIHESAVLSGDYFTRAVAKGDITGFIELSYRDYANIVSLKNRGLILPLDEYLSESEAYGNLTESMKKAFVFADNRTWAISATTPTGIYSRKVRTEWVEAVGLDIPGSLDELYEVAKAFANEDPNQNKETDEHGIDLYLPRASDMLKDIFAAKTCYLSNFGGSSIAYDYSTGAFEDAMLKPGMAEALNYIKTLSVEGILHANNNWNYKADDSVTTGIFYEEEASTESYDHDIWTPVYNLGDGEYPRTYVRGPEKCFALASNTNNPEKKVKAFVNTFYSDMEGMLLGVYGEKGVNYNGEDNQVSNVWNGINQADIYKKNIRLLHPNYWMFYENDIRLFDNLYGGDYAASKVDQIKVFEEIFADNDVIIDNWLPLHSDYKKYQSHFGEAIISFLAMPDTVSVEGFIENYINNARKYGAQEILDELNAESDSYATYSYD